MAAGASPGIDGSRGREMRGKLFAGVKQWELEQPGIKFKLPVFYYDNTSLQAIYTASTTKVKKLLPDPQMNLIEMSPGRCTVVFTAFEYRNSDLGPYNEFSISFPIAFQKRQIPGLTLWSQMRHASFTVHIWKLPVTTEIARRGGVELYGYPKFLADIFFDKGKEWVSCRLAEEGEEILTLTGRVLPTAGQRTSRIVTYSIIDDIPLSANVVIHALEFAQSRDGQAARVTVAGNHPISEILRQIELGANPAVYEFSPVTEAILFAGRNLMDA
jgi:hypothetical protein